MKNSFFLANDFEGRAQQAPVFGQTEKAGNLN